MKIYTDLNIGSQLKNAIIKALRLDWRNEVDERIEKQREAHYESIDQQLKNLSNKDWSFIVAFQSSCQYGTPCEQMKKVVVQVNLQETPCDETNKKPELIEQNEALPSCCGVCKCNQTGNGSQSNLRPFHKLTPSRRF